MEDEPDTEEPTEETRREIEEFITRTFCSPRPGVNVTTMNRDRIVWFKNWKSLKSVHALGKSVELPITKWCVLELCRDKFDINAQNMSTLCFIKHHKIFWTESQRVTGRFQRAGLVLRVNRGSDHGSTYCKDRFICKLANYIGN